MLIRQKKMYDNVQVITQHAKARYDSVVNLYLHCLWKTKRVHQEQKGCFVNAFCLKRQVQKLDIVYTDAAHLNNKIIFIFVVCSNDGFFFFLRILF